MTRTSITWILPGIRATYSGEPKPYLSWLRCTAVGGRGLWSMWFIVAWGLIRAGEVPTPKRIGGCVVELIGVVTGP